MNKPHEYLYENTIRDIREQIQTFTGSQDEYDRGIQIGLKTAIDILNRHIGECSVMHVENICKQQEKINDMSRKCGINASIKKHEKFLKSLSDRDLVKSAKGEI